jgi:ABC-2 type transport system ATP-binding protein
MQGFHNAGPAALKIRGLRKQFGSVVAVDGLDLSVPSGALFGFLGPNGAGKSTTLACITGLLEPTSGEISLLGKPLDSGDVGLKRRVGVMPSNLALFDHLYAPEFLLFQASLFGLSAREAEKRVSELLQALELTGASGRRLADFSSGMRKKVAFAAAVIHSPEILFLDEPFESIDPAGVAMMKRWLREFVANGRTVVLTTHVLDTVERLCDRVAILNSGRLAWQGSMSSLRDGGSFEWQGRSFISIEDLFLAIVGHSDVTPGWL